MYQIQRVLNNNSILVNNEQEEAMIFMGKGIGFGKKVNDLIDYDISMDIYRFEKHNDKGNAMEIIESVEPMFIEASAMILQEAVRVFGMVDTNILLPLADHIAFSIERMKQNMLISNPFSNEIRLLYPEEYAVAQKGKAIISNVTGFEINEDEVGYITLHVHSALCHDLVPQSMQAAIIIKESIEEVGRDFQIQIDTNSMSYVRLMNHMKFLLLRLRTEEELQLDVSDFVKERFAYAYACALRICKQLEKAFQKPIAEVEIGYLALHIERIRTSEMKKQQHG